MRLIGLAVVLALWDVNRHGRQNTMTQHILVPHFRKD